VSEHGIVFAGRDFTITVMFLEHGRIHVHRDAYVKYSYVERMNPKMVDAVWLKTAVMKNN
jgi:hypothetical protein